MTHIVVLGTSHTLQCGHSSEPAASVQMFEAEVRKLIAQYSIARVAEEMSSDGLARHEVSETVAQRIAREIGTEYQQVDLSQTERANLDLGDGPLFTIQRLYRPPDCGQGFRDVMFEIEGEIRERIWTFRILNLQSSPVLFICGALHVGAIVRIWHLLGLKCDVAHHDFAPYRPIPTNCNNS